MIHLASVTIRWYSSPLAKRHTGFWHVPVSTDVFLLVILKVISTNITTITTNATNRALLADILAQNALDAHPRVTSDSEQPSA
jgi:hypothetical protein